jgi:glycosyltransferase involved in cell wall biosynthesis
MKPALTVVIPVYDSEPLLEALAARLHPVLASQAEVYELVFVDDGSRDGSWSVVCELARRHEWVRGIRMLRNYGQHNALLCGIRSARHGIVVTMDDDLQHPPEELPKLLAALGEDCDVVYGTPERQQHGLARDLASQLTKLALQKSMGASTARQVSAWRVFRTELRNAFAGYQSQFVSIDVLLTWGTTRFRAVPVRHDPRAIGQSNYTWSKLCVHALNMITGYSVLPLQLAGLIGFLFALFGLAVLTYVLVIYFAFGSPVKGFTFLTSVIAIFSGAQLFALGIIGEYLARMHFRMMDRPSYAVRTTSDGS